MIVKKFGDIYNIARGSCIYLFKYRYRFNYIIHGIRIIDNKQFGIKIYKYNNF